MLSPDSDAPRYSMWPPVVTGLLLANGLIFLAESLAENFLVVHFALWPLGTDGQLFPPFGAEPPPFRPWQLLSYGFLHADTLHLFTNMFAVWMFGTQIENLWGSRLFAFYYAVCVIGAGLTQLVVSTLAAESGQLVPTIGASGGVFGILLAFGMMFPNQRLLLLIPPVPIKAKWLVLLYGLFELYAGVTGTMSQVAHFAHLGGMLFGFLLILYWRRKVARVGAERF